jgi:hypothetical protein
VLDNVLLTDPVGHVNSEILHRISFGTLIFVPVCRCRPYCSLISTMKEALLTCFSKDFESNCFRNEESQKPPLLRPCFPSVSLWLCRTAETSVFSCNCISVVQLLSRKCTETERERERERERALIINLINLYATYIFACNWLGIFLCRRVFNTIYSGK